MSKKISQLTLKNSLASTDVLTILDSEDNYENKKILASSISGGGSSTLSGLTDVNIDSQTLADGQLLAYDDIGGKWVNSTETYVTAGQLATVAVTGEYTDLEGLPSIPSTLNDLSNVNIDSNTLADGQLLKYDANSSKWINGSGSSSTVAWSDVTGKPNFATVATSGSYNDLTDKPTIPTVNDATLTIEKNGTSVGTFTANASSASTINIVETVQSASSPLSISSNALSISQADTSTNGYLSSTDWNTFNGKQDAINSNNKLDYAYLSNTPTIPTVNDATLTIEKNGTSVGTFTANASSNATINITETVQSASAPLSITSNALSISQSDTSTNGYLSSTDWNTFNGKVSPQTVVSSANLNATIANVDANTRYVFTSNLMSLTITAVTDSVLESEIQFTTDLSFTFTDNAGLTWMLIDAPTFESLTEYVIAIKNGYAVLGKVGA